uniref:G-protein coupled receptors family 3 profile domain-containing protein n=1 Tax=Xenopus tropicalis TaxID=8364 RepID=A0A1B8Y786_XENTR
MLGFRPTHNPFQILIHLLVLCIRQSKAEPIKPACCLKPARYWEDFEYIQDGDIIIGGLLTVNTKTMRPLREFKRKGKRACVEQLVEFRLAIEEINKNPSLLPNVTLGYHIYDSCGNGMKAVRSTLQILSETVIFFDVVNYISYNTHSISPSGRGGSVTVSSDLSPTVCLQVSFGASDPSLSDRVAFPFLFRTLQSFHGSALAISKLLKHFGWTWVGIIGLNDGDMADEPQVLTDYISRDGICVEFTFNANRYLTKLTGREGNRMYGIIRKSTTHIIIVCGKSNSAFLFLRCLRSLHIVDNKTLILSPSASVIGNYMKFTDFTFDDILIFEPYPVYPRETHEIIDFINRTHPSKDPKDKLFENIMWKVCECLVKDPHKNKVYESISVMDDTECDGKEATECLSTIISSLLAALSPNVHLAVNIMSQAIHEMHTSLREQSPERDREAHRYQYQLHHYLNKSHYQTKYGGEVSFDGRGEMDTGYIIYFFPNETDGTYLGTLGRFIPSAPSEYKLIIYPDAIPWEMMNKTIPRSQCTDSCQPGYRKAVNPGAQPCCYGCLPCSEGEISNRTDSENCIRCPDLEWPNDKRNQCIAKTEEFLSFTDGTISVSLLSITVLFSLITLLMLRIFILYRDSPIVRANNRSLSFLLLVSIKLSFLSVFLFLGRPVDITCMLRIITFGITFSIAVSSLLAKTIMVCVAFKATKPGSSWRKWLGVKLSNSVVLFCSSIQIIICMTWLAISPPFQELDIHTSPGTIIIQCNEGSAIGFYSVIGYMGLLAAVSFVLAFLARSLPDSFNEAKYITFSMLLFCSVWITMIPAYLSTKGKNTVCVEIFAILTSSAGLLACIFLPKCYIIMFRPEMNQKSCLLGSKT